MVVLITQSLSEHGVEELMEREMLRVLYGKSLLAEHLICCSLKDEKNYISKAKKITLGPCNLFTQLLVYVAYAFQAFLAASINTSLRIQADHSPPVYIFKT
jgi:hypothetical protein